FLFETGHLALREKQKDNLEEALKFYDQSRQSIQKFLRSYERLDGDRTQGVMAGFAAQKEFARCQDRLVPLAKYLELQIEGQPQPDWNWLHKVIAWRDLFERLPGQKKLNVNTLFW